MADSGAGAGVLVAVAVIGMIGAITVALINNSNKNPEAEAPSAASAMGTTELPDTTNPRDSTEPPSTPAPDTTLHTGTTSVPEQEGPATNSAPPTSDTATTRGPTTTKTTPTTSPTTTTTQSPTTTEGPAQTALTVENRCLAQAAQTAARDRIQFEERTDHAFVTISFALDRQSHVLWIARGQSISVSAVADKQAQILVCISGARLSFDDGAMLTAASSANEFVSGPLPSAQDYYLTFVPISDAGLPSMTLRIVIPP